jgi:hypothetical protein
MSEEKKAFGRVKGQTKSQSIISDALLSPYEIQVDDYSYTVIDSTKTGNNFCGSFTRLENAVNKVIQYQLANKRETYSLNSFIESYKSIKENLAKISI